jgi:hypothetical protein
MELLMNATNEPATQRPRKAPRYATETILRDGRIEIGGARTRHKVLVEPGPTTSWQEALLRVSGHPRAMNATINRMFAGRWDPLTRTWTVPASKGLVLRAYLAEHL